VIWVVDDERTHPGADVHFRNSDVALSALARHWTNWYREPEWPRIDELWLDHDLGGDDTAMPVVRFIRGLDLALHPLGVDTIIIHTQNPVARENMLFELSSLMETNVVVGVLPS
jgi:hypothetical protein